MIKRIHHFALLLGLPLLPLLLAAQTITSFFPTAGPPGTPITITGTGYNPSKNVVYFGSVTGHISSGDSNSLRVMVPIGASFLPISVTDTSTGLTGYSKSPFNVTFASQAFSSSSFAAKVDFVAVADPRGLAIGDIDGDGKADLVMTSASFADVNSGRVSVLRNTASAGNISFATRVDFLPPAALPQAVALGDIDGDGRLDMAAVGSNGNILSIYRNTSSSGNVSFDAKVDLSTGTYPIGIAIADLDLDGKPDVVVANQNSGTVSIFRNTSSVGSISLAARIDSVTGSSPTGIAIGDLDGDNKPDIVIANYFSNTMSIFRNASSSGSISLAERQDFSTNTQPSSIALGDLDGDGNIDIVIGNDFPSVSVYRNTSSFGSISLSPRVDFSFGATGNSAHRIAIGDVDGDVKPDIVSADWNQNTLSIFRNKSSPGTINSSSFASRINFSTGSTPYSVATGDLDGDGKTDLAVVNDGSSSVSTFRNTISPLFTDIADSLTGVSSSSVAWGDYDNDGDLDILLTGYSGSENISKIYRNNDGTYVDANASLISVRGGAAEWGDYNSDGNLDILLTGYTETNRVTIVYSNDGGNFVDINAPLIGVSASAVVWGDYDNDGDLDILLSGYVDDTQLGVSKIYRNDDGNFVDVSASLEGVYYGSVAWGDYDNDGDLDILLTGAGQSSKVTKIYRNDNASFVDINVTIPGVANYGNRVLAWGDYDTDGDLDIVLTGYTGSTSISKVYRNNSGNFIDINASLLGVTNCSVAWGDYDNDGDLDILLAGHSVRLGEPICKVYRNDDGVFNDIGGLLTGVAEGPSVHWGDYDNDGDLDILLAGETSPVGYITRIYRNNIAIANTVPSAPTSLISISSNDSVTFSWALTSDAETPSPGLTYNLRVGTTPGGSEIMPPHTNTATGYRRIPALGNVNHNTSWAIQGLAEGNYYWSVQAVDAGFMGSAFAAEQIFAVSDLPAAPQNLTAIPGDQQVTLTWSPNTESDLSHYVVYQSTTSGFTPSPSDSVARLNKPDTSVILTELSADTTYYFKIAAVDSSGNKSSYSAEASATPYKFIVSTYPPQNALNVPVDTTISVTFWVDMNPAAINENTFVAHGSYTGKLSGAYSYDSPTKTATFTPTSPFKVGESVSVMLTQGIQTLVGDPLLQSYSYSFYIKSFDGSGVFSQSIDLNISTPLSLASGDWDSDGSLDLATLNYGNGRLVVLANDGQGNFTQTDLVDVGNEPRSTLSGDWNNDGDLDIAVSSSYGCVWILDNNGLGEFTKTDTVFVGGDPRSMSTHDFDGDGDFDIAVCQQSSQKVSILINDGGGDFTQATMPSLNSQPYKVMVVDWDADGDQDLAVITYFDVSILSNDGSGGFLLTSTLSTNGEPRTGMAGDFDGDGDVDIAVTNVPGFPLMTILLNDGHGSVENAYTVTLDDSYSCINNGDWDSDGDLDAIVGNVILQNDGLGNFVQSASLSSIANPGSISEGDWDGDGDLDLAIAPSATNTIGIFFNANTEPDIMLSNAFHDFGDVESGESEQWSFDIYNQGGIDTLVVSSIISSNPDFTISPKSGTVPVGDTLTIAITFAPTEVRFYDDSLTIYSSDPDEPVVYFYLTGTGTPTVVATTPAAHDVSAPENSPVSVTFSVDMDPATLNANTFRIFGEKRGLYGGTYTYDAGTRTATFTPDQPFAYGEHVQVVLTEDVQADNDAIPLAGGYSFTFTVNALFGSGQYVAHTPIATGSTPFALAAGDLDGDGFDDLVVANSADNTVSLYVNDQQGGLTFHSTLATGANPQGVVLGDFDADGDVDILVANNSENTLSLLMNNGGMIFNSETTPDRGLGPRSMAIEDLNNDGWLDVVNANYQGNDTFIYLGNGTSTISWVDNYVTGSSPAGAVSGVVVGDIDRDGLLDILVTNRDDHNVSILLNQGTASFLQASSHATASTPNDLIVYDIDADTDDDIITVNGTSNNISILRNDGTGAFSSATNVNTGSQPIAPTAYDADADGDLDVAVANFSSNDVHILSNDGLGNFTPTDTIAVGNGPRDIVALDMSGGFGIMDLVVVNLSDNTLTLLSNQIPEGIFANVSLATPGEQSGDVPVSYAVYDVERGLVNLKLEYSTDRGTTWQPATVAGDTSALAPGAHRGTLTWDSASNLPGQDREVVFKITPYRNGIVGTPDSVTFQLDNNLPPTVAIDALLGEQSGDIQITYQLSDAEGDTLSIRPEYYDVAANVWTTATITGYTTGIFQYANSLTWHSRTDLPEGAGNIDFRITPSDLDPGVSDTVTFLLDNLGLPLATITGSPTGEVSGDLTFSYQIIDDEKDLVSLLAQYSLNGTDAWQNASVVGDTSLLDSTRYTGDIVWQSGVDEPGIDAPTTRFRIVPRDAHAGFIGESGLFHLDNNNPPALALGTVGDTIVTMLTLPYALSDAEGDSLTLSASYSLDQGASWEEGHLDYACGKIAPADYTGTVDWLAFADLAGKHESVQLQVVPADYDPGVGDTLTGLTVIYYPGDYTGDLLISTDDLAQFAAAWNAQPQDLIYEIGPATGTPPDLVPQPDGVLDFEDLTIFAQMWNWSFAHNGFAKSIPTLAKAISENPSIRLVQRIPEDLYRWDGNILVDLFADNDEGLMMVDGVVSYASDGFHLMEVKDGGYLRQFFEATPLFTQVSPDSSQALFALAGLGTVEPGKVDDLPVATLRFRPKAHESPPLILDYTLTGMDGGPFETGQVQIEVENLMPKEFALHQNYPNPFNPNTTIRFELPKAAKVYLVVYDILGREVTKLKQEQLGAGYHQVLWDCRDQAGRGLASGIYFTRLVTPGYSKTMKMLLLK